MKGVLGGTLGRFAKRKVVLLSILFNSELLMSKAEFYYSSRLDYRHRHFGENLSSDMHSSDSSNLSLGLEDDSVAQNL